MRKTVCFILFAAMSLALFSCAAGDSASQGKTVNEVLKNEVEQKTAVPTTAEPATEPSETETKTEPPETETAPVTAPSDVDVDLSLLSGVVVYSELSSIIAHADEYVGKTFRITGAFAIYESEDRIYYACLITDATACCSQGLEFVLRDTSLNYPDDYPALGTEITVVGVFDTYREGPYTYSQLIDAVIENRNNAGAL